MAGGMAQHEDREQSGDDAWGNLVLDEDFIREAGDRRAVRPGPDARRALAPRGARAAAVALRRAARRMVLQQGAPTQVAPPVRGERRLSGAF